MFCQNVSNKRVELLKHVLDFDEILNICKIVIVFWISASAFK